MPFMGKATEVIFIEGHSTDGTWEEIERVCKTYKGRFTLQSAKQAGKGKFDAVKKGFDMATGDLLMILDADLTVPPEELPKFYDAIASGKAEYVHGSRLIYPLEKQAMRTLNIMGNKIFSLILSWLLGQRITDALCGTKVLSKRNWDKISSNRQHFRTLDPFGDFDIIYGVAKHNLKMLEIPIRYQARDYGTTNIMRFRHGWMLLKMVFLSMSKTKFT
jgi:glycosyltransferase involved in cell wall biosynthesis